MRAFPLNPRAPALPRQVAAVKQAAAVTVAPAPGVKAKVPRDVEAKAEREARAGGFHESSYELKHGLEINESEWPPDVTQPGAL